MAKKNDQPLILLVDDEPNILLALEFLLQRESYRVEKAFNGIEAVEKAGALRPDIIVLDVMMPGMDGYEAAKKIRQNPALEDTCIVFLTAKGTGEDKQRGYKTGGEYYLVKPFDNDTFVYTIREILEFGR